MFGLAEGFYRILIGPQRLNVKIVSMLSRALKPNAGRHLPAVVENLLDGHCWTARFQLDHITRLHESYTPKFRMGEIVQLNSGGPKMMIVDLNNGVVITAWRDSGKPIEHHFPEACVKHAALLD